jgi:hypothetical protein
MGLPGFFCGQGEKGKRGKGERGKEIGKEFDRLAGII